MTKTVKLQYPDLEKATRGAVGELRGASAAMRRLGRDATATQRSIAALRRGASLMGDTWRRATAGIGRSMRGGGLAGRVVRWGGGMATAASAGRVISRSANLSAQFARLESDARGWEDPTFRPAVQRSILAAAKRWRVETAEVIAGVNQVISDTGDRALALQSIAPIARGIQATGAGGQDLGRNVSGISSYGVDIETGIAAMTAAGVRGTLPLRIQATEVGRVHNAFRKMGGLPGGLASMQQVTALFQSAAEQRGGDAGAAEAASDIVALGRMLLRPPKEWEEQNIRTGGELIHTTPRTPCPWRSGLSTFSFRFCGSCGTIDRSRAASPGARRRSARSPRRSGTSRSHGRGTCRRSCAGPIPPTAADRGCCGSPPCCRATRSGG